MSKYWTGLLLCVLGLLLTPSAWGAEQTYQSPPLCPGLLDRPLRNAGGTQTALTISDTAISLTVPTGANSAVIGVRGASIRYRDDGTAPTATTGIQVDAGDVIVVCSGSIARFQMIRTAGDATVNILYYQ